jgi:hypothetical protein
MGFLFLAILLSLDPGTRHRIGQGHLESKQWYSGWELRCWAKVTREMDRGLHPRFDCGTHLSGQVDMRDPEQGRMGLGTRRYLLVARTWWSVAASCRLGFHNKNFQLLI